MNALADGEPVIWKVNFGVRAVHGQAVSHQPALIYLRKGERYVVTLEIRLNYLSLHCTLLSTRVTPVSPVLRVIATSFHLETTKLTSS